MERNPLCTYGKHDNERNVPRHPASLRWNARELEQAIRQTEADIVNQVQRLGVRHAQCYHYGALDIDPGYLAIWIIVNTDADKAALNHNQAMLDSFKRRLVENGYPSRALPSIHIGAESQETIDRESQGNWYYHFK